VPPLGSRPGCLENYGSQAANQRPSTQRQRFSRGGLICPPGQHSSPSETSRFHARSFSPKRLFRERSEDPVRSRSRISRRTGTRISCSPHRTAGSYGCTCTMAAHRRAFRQSHSPLTLRGPRRLRRLDSIQMGWPTRFMPPGARARGPRKSCGSRTPVIRTNHSQRAQPSSIRHFLKSAEEGSTGFIPRISMPTVILISSLRGAARTESRGTGTTVKQAQASPGRLSLLLMESLPSSRQMSIWMMTSI